MANRTDQPAPQPSPAPGDMYTYADAVAHCPIHRAQHEEAEARYAEYGESIRRRDRRTLGLRTAHATAATA